MKNDDFNLFQRRKEEHISHALKTETEAIGLSELDKVTLEHNALPNIDFSEISISSQQLKIDVPTPFLVSSMTAGHPQGVNINERLMAACQQTGWAMGVGSQRRELEDSSYQPEWQTLKKSYPNVRLLGNIGISQLISANIDDIKRLIDNLGAVAIQIHLNALQECIQPEGTPNFKGSLNAIEKLCQKLDTPVIIKETGCGFSANTVKKLADTGIAALDISGFGGTHWGRIEGARSLSTMHQQAAISFRNWGVSTVSSLKNAKSCQPSYEIWGSGGVRSGLDAAKLLALGATTIGFAKPMLQAALVSSEKTVELMNTIAYELKIALFCTGFKTIKEFKEGCHVKCHH